MAKCSRCRKRGRFKWTVQPCALGRKKLTFWLCAAHDIAENRYSLRLANYPHIAAAMKAYIGH